VKTYHPLTNILRASVSGYFDSEKTDEKIRQYLGEKVEKIDWVNVDPRDIFELTTEQTLEEKFQEVWLSQPLPQELAQIATTHFEEKQ
jgi:hypothetical protein